MDTPERHNTSAGDHRFSDAARARLRADDFAEKLRVRLLERELRAEMLGMAASPVKLDRWELRAAIDQGAMGAVFRAFDPTLRCEVAIKLLICPDGADLQERRSRMEGEAQAMAQLGHPNVLRVQNFIPASTDEEGGEVPSFLVMDFVAGMTLLQWQREAPAGWQGIVEKYAQVAAGLAHIHQSGLVHRDIKPANVLVRRTGEALIGDFGLVHEADRQTEGAEVGEDGPLTASDRLTQKGAILGTLAYMAPEQLREGTTSARSDQFSFFVALYEALYDRLPFAGETRSDLLEAMLRDRVVIEGGPRRPPRWLRRLLLRGLAVDPAERHASMDLVAGALKAGLRPKDRGNLWTTAGGMVVGAAIFAVFVRGQGDPCQDVGQLVEWSPPRQAAAHAGFLTSGIESVGAEAAWSRFHGSADGYARSWGSLKRSTCEVLEGGREDDPGEAELALQRDACLDDSAALLGKFMERYRQARAGDVLYSENAAFELQEGLRRCESDALRRVDPAALARRTEEAHEMVRDRLASAFVLEIGGAYMEAAELAEEALSAARRLGDPGIEAQAALRLGRIRSLLREEDSAVDLLHHAFTLANSIVRDDVAADAMIELVKVLALDTGDLRRAAALETMAESFVERLGGEDPRREAAVAEARGILAREQGRRDDAIELHRRALGKRRSRPETPTEEYIRSHVNLANALTEPGHDDDALAEARELYEQAIARALALGESHPITANTRRAYAGFLRENLDFIAAQREAEASLAVVQRVYSADSREAADLHVLLGTLAVEALGDQEPDAAALAPARAHLEAAIKHFEAMRRPGIVDSEHILALHLSAVIHGLEGESTRAIADYERALEVLRSSADHQELLADTLGYLGELLVDLHRPAEALPMLRQAWEIVTLSSAGHDESHAVLVAAMAVAQAETGDLPGARRTALDADALARELGLGDDDGILSQLDPILSAPRIKEEKRETSHGSL